MKILVDMLITTDSVDTEAAEKAKLEAEKLMEKYKNSKEKTTPNKESKRK